ncbi:hypothetical protein GCM10018953_66950 [Streptosporangium nondiastaticum]|uniref:Uncharacterized protein n=1 Tax=Streptosporangium sandarakinum TaxID=1260955 RepID=A0A852V8B1_9ACTN|nr:hypothetical protein [Streptosporangium sandarakinum]NYF43798.1 hypothetical protein [Streptosporangium sandarakinum]
MELGVLSALEGLDDEAEHHVAELMAEGTDDDAAIADSSTLPLTTFLEWSERPEPITAGTLSAAGPLSASP